MNEKTAAYIQSVGSLVETWMVVYRTFIAQGLPVGDALVHTKEFMTAFMDSVINAGKDEEK